MTYQITVIEQTVSTTATIDADSAVEAVERFCASRGWYCRFGRLDPETLGYRSAEALAGSADGPRHTIIISQII